MGGQDEGKMNARSWDGSYTDELEISWDGMDTQEPGVSWDGLDLLESDSDALRRYKTSV